MMCHIAVAISDWSEAEVTILMTHLRMSLIMTSVRVRHGNRCDGFIPYEIAA